MKRAASRLRQILIVTGVECAPRSTNYKRSFEVINHHCAGRVILAPFPSRSAARFLNWLIMIFAARFVCADQESDQNRRNGSISSIVKSKFFFSLFCSVFVFWSRDQSPSVWSKCVNEKWSSFWIFFYDIETFLVFSYISCLNRGQARPCCFFSSLHFRRS